MAADNEYLTSNRRIRYPFSDNSLLPIDDSKASIVFGCFVDALVQLKSPYLDIIPIVRGIGVSGHTITFRLDGSTSGISRVVPITCTRTQKNFQVVSGVSDWCWYTFVLSSSGIREYEENVSLIGDIALSCLTLNARCVGQTPAFLNSLRVYGGKGCLPGTTTRYTRSEAILLDPDVILSGPISIRAGNNIRFGEESGGFSITAKPGYGDGRLPCPCDDREVRFKTEGLLSKDGHTRLFNDTCYDLSPSKYAQDKGVLVMHAKCKACCTCEMYASIVNDKLVPLRDEIIADKGSLANTYSTYDENVRKWNERIANALPEDVVVTTTAVMLDAAATNLAVSAEVTGKMDRCGFSVMVRNDSFVTIRVELDEFMSNGEPFEAQVGYMQDKNTPVVLPVDLGKYNNPESSSESGDSGGSDSGEPPIFSIDLEPGRSSNLTYFIRRTSLVRTDHQKGFLSRLKISAYQGERLIITRREVVAI